MAGNIGTPLSDHALDFPADGLVVAEVSSFQLESTIRFRPRVAAVLNITPDHLDRHGTLAAYVEAKARIFLNQTSADGAVLNADDPLERPDSPTAWPAACSGSVVSCPRDMACSSVTVGSSPR